MKMRTLTVAVALTLAGGIAQAQDVKVDFDKDANFGALKTFNVKVATSWGNPLGEKRVVGEITQALTEKGWTPAADGAADALVVLHGATEKQKSLNTFYSGGYGGYGWRGGWGGGMGTATTTVDEYTVGTLVVDIFDAKSKALVYRGTATDELSNKPEKNAKKLAKASDKLFKDFPPGSAKKK
jgi:hypothetical protein